MKKKILIIFLIIVVLLVIIIGMKRCRGVSDSSQMPDIVFLNIVDYTKVRDDVDYAMTFYDKNGVHYTTRDPYVLGLSFQELVEEYRAGNLDDKITYHMTCDVDELLENYQKLCKVSGDWRLELVYPEAIPQVEKRETTWYGLYYDMSGNIKSVVLHKKDAAGDVDTNNKTANEIYDWYIGTFQQ